MRSRPSSKSNNELTGAIIVKQETIKANDDLIAGLTDEELTKRFVKAVKINNEIKLAKGAPIAKFDRKTGRPYLRYPDGRREYA